MAGYGVAVSVVDNATGTLNKINAQFDQMNRRVASLRAPFERFGTAAIKLGDVSGVSRLSGGVTELGRRIGGVTATLGRFSPAMGAVYSAATLAGMARLVQSWTDFGVRLGLESTRANMAASSLHGLQGAARLANASAESLTSGMSMLGDNLTNAVAGRAPDTVMMLSTLGIAFRDNATGGARLAKDVLPEIADKIKSIRNPTQQALVATTLFGQAGENLLPFLRLGAAGIREYNETAARYGLLNQRGVDAAYDLSTAQTKLGLAFEGVGYTIAERVGPVLTPMLERLADWVAAHREDIGRFFEDVATKVAKWVDTGGIERTIQAVENFATKISETVDKLGGWGTAFEAFFGVWVGAKALAMFGKITQVVGLLGRLGLIAAAPEIAVPAAIGAAGGAAGAMHMPMLDETGRIIGNWGGAQGERAVEILGRIEDAIKEATKEGEGGYGRATPSERIGRGAGPGLNQPVPPVTPLAPGERTRNAGEMAREFAAAGWTREAQAAILGGGIQESGLNPRSGTGTAHQGVFQWDAERRNAIETQFHKPVVDMTPAETARAAIWEVDNNPRFAGLRRPLRESHNFADLNDKITRHYEAPGNYDWEVPHRASLGMGVLDAMNRAPNQGRQGPPPGSPAGPPAEAAPAPVLPPVATSGPQGAPGPDGKATVRLSFDNPPAGMRTSTVQQGGLRVETPTLGNVP